MVNGRLISRPARPRHPLAPLRLRTAARGGGGGGGRHRRGSGGRSRRRGVAVAADEDAPRAEPVPRPAVHQPQARERAAARGWDGRGGGAAGAAPCEGGELLRTPPSHHQHASARREGCTLLDTLQVRRWRHQCGRGRCTSYGPSQSKAGAHRPGAHACHVRGRGHLWDTTVIG